MNRPKIHVEKVHAFTGHKDCLYSVEKSGQPEVFFSAGADGMVVRWDLQNPAQGVLMAKTNQPIYALRFVESTGHLVVGENFEGIHLIDVATRKEIASLKTDNSAIFDIQVMENRLYLALGSGHLWVADYHSMVVYHKLALTDQHLRTLALHPERRELAVGASDNLIRIFDIDSMRLKCTLNGHGFSVFTLQYTPDGRFLMSGSRDAHLKIWDTQAEYQEYRSIVAHMYTINHIAFSPDGRLFATCSKDKSVKVWDAAHFQLLKVIDKARHAGHGTSVNKLLWADNTRLISCSDDRSVSLWELHFLETHAI